MTLDQYITKLNTLYQTGIAREHAYRGDLQQLLMDIVPDVLVTNEPARVACGAPDYVLTRKDVPIGYIEAKDIGVDLVHKSLKEQFDRYKNGLSNLIFTDYLDFHFYKDGELVTKIAIGKIVDGVIVSNSENFEQFNSLIKNFVQTISQTIKSPTKLAKMMAGKAKLMAHIIETSLNSDDEVQKISNLKGQMLTFKQMLIHDIDNKSFADIYAQTIAYGMFAARYHDPSLPTFSREEAATLIPKSNPFLRKLFQDIAGYDLDTRLVWIVDELVSIFLASDVAQIMKNFGRSTKQEDPVVHFYETFLGEYNPALRKARGVWYTPQPVVNFIVRAVDDILKTEFNLLQGLADTSKTKIKVKAVTKATDDRRSKVQEVTVEKEVHRVQILDPATGTGTFLAEVVKHIYKKFEGQQGIWSKYVTDNLIPRLNGFELLMASYAMAHLKMDMLLTETGYKPVDDQRFKIFLTNSLEEATDQQFDLFNWLADEANQANQVKKEAPVMVVIGNPPYSGESANKGEWIMGLMEDYKKEPGGKEKLKEQNSKFINDDYVKFMRFGQHFIDKNGEGILAFINPHGYLDNPTFRGMRWNLLKTYDKIYTIDLHGNGKKNETTIDGSVDQNVFDIMQGVSINLLIKTGKKKVDELGQVFHYDLFGKREFKYDYLNEHNLKNIDFKEIPNKAPMYFMVQKDFAAEDIYNEGFALNNIFNINSLGLLTKRDRFITDFNKNDIENRLKDFLNTENSNDYLSKKYDLKLKDNDKWDLIKSRKELLDKGIIIENFKIQNYRCFDKRIVYYDTNFVARLNTKVLGNFNKSNIALISTRQLADNNFRHIFISNIISDQCFISNKTKEGCQVFPLYLYPENTGQQSAFETAERVPNLNMEIVNKIAEDLGMFFSPEQPDYNLVTEETNQLYPINILDYIYAVLHSPSYRETYKEFLKIDFPRVPYPKSIRTFIDLVALGRQLRELHLLESPTVEKYITKYPIDGDNIVGKPTYKNGNVYINETQYFEGVPEVAWNFYIGGYQPAQKWLKDRKDRELDYEDILHYQKMIVAMTETNRIMGEIDEIEI
ncbi:type ISP restriction/modification enzyme [Flavobacterium sp.]|uniref:type ISP restriction/modification enzyme n=1 Tax=Flavobacterium sp. TaxID=239 RepID=UPI002CECDDBC|nr:type ISP restriction/modification enzyme [Flavobacterium sp.]HQA75008.1 N-6 DNA methylase [Flavobacterium sp.]